MLTHDVYAETNPALCALLAASFSSGYMAIKGAGPELSLFYLSLPLVLSGDVQHCFDKTAKTTVLGEWLLKNPRVTIGFAERVNGTLAITTEGVRFGLMSNMLAFSGQAEISTSLVGAEKVTLAAKHNPTILSFIKHAERLGSWFAKAGSTRSVFEAFGVTL